MARHLKLVLTTFFFSVFLSCSVNAQSGTSNLKFHGTLTVVNCSVNGDADTPTIEFGDVRTDLIDGVKYSKPLPVKITCTGDTSSLDLKYQVKGDVSTFDNKSLKTNITGLGLKVLNATGTQLGINTWVTTSPGETLNLKVVPVKDGTTVLSGGEFNAIATLIIQMK